MSRWAAALVVCATLSSPSRAEACAGCSNPNLPGARASSTPLAKGQVQLALNLAMTTMRVVHSEACPDIGPICSQRAEPPQVHDLRLYAAELRPIVAVGITDMIGVELQTPVRLLSTSVVFRRLDGSPANLDYENIHHRDETLFGIGDPWLLGRVGRVFGDLTLTGRLGTGIPLAGTQPDPFARGRAGLPHQHVQFGTWIFSPIAALDASLTIDRFRLAAYLQTVLFPYENHHGYQAGNRYLGGLSADASIVGGLRAGLGVDLVNEQPERWRGVVYQDGNVGRTDFLAGGAVSYVAGRWAAALSVKVPVWQHIIQTSHAHGGDPGQLTYPAIVSLSVQHSFGGPEPARAPAGH